MSCEYARRLCKIVILIRHFRKEKTAAHAKTFFCNCGAYSVLRYGVYPARSEKSSDVLWILC